MATLSVALKEWDLQIAALLSGRQVFILRKGGILESENQFVLEHERFLLFPTFVHQDPKMVKAEFRAGLTSVREEPSRVVIRGYAEVAKVFEVPSRERLERLNDLYIWDGPLLDMRFAYRAEKPLYLVMLRAFELKEAVGIANTLEYAGCKSWVPLGEEVDVEGARQVVKEGELGGIGERVEGAFSW